MKKSKRKKVIVYEESHILFYLLVLGSLLVMLLPFFSLYELSNLLTDPFDIPMTTLTTHILLFVYGFFSLGFVLEFKEELTFRRKKKVEVEMNG